jgi:ELWxxDGT repeat protein
MDVNAENIVSVKSLERFSDDGSEESPYQNVMVFNYKLFLNARMNGGLKFASFTTSSNTLTAIKDIDAATLSSGPNFFLRVDDLVYFETNFEVSEPNDPWVGSPQELYRTDGTATGTFKIANLHYGSKVAIGDKLFFSRSIAAGWSLCYTYGTREAITTVLSGTGTSVPRNLTNVHGVLYYFNDTGELWKSDGTTSGTVLLRNLNKITSITDVNGKGFMLSETADGGLELWRTNTTGLVKVKTLRTGPATATRSYPTAAVGNMFYFVANDGIHGNEVWRSDGTSIGTYMISDGNTSDDIDTYQFEADIPSFTVYNNTLYYSAQDRDNNWALWSATGNVKLTGFDAVDNSIVFKGKMFLFPRIVPESRFHTIYVSDGTMPGTTYLGNLADQGGISFAILNDKLFFSSGRLTTSDGTVCGTYQIPGGYGAYPIEGIGNDLIFASSSYKTGEELFIYRDLGSITNSDCFESIADAQSSDTNSITLYPNPYTDEFTLKINNSGDKSIDIEVYDASGCPIQIIQDMQSNKDLGHFGANWPKGIYFVKANVGGRITTTRIAKR